MASYAAHSKRVLTKCRLMLPVIGLPETITVGPLMNVMQVRYTKHYHPKWKNLRGMKMIKVKLPDFHENMSPDTMTPEEVTAKMKERGIKPSRAWTERPINIACTGATFEPYVPPEGDGRASSLSVAGTKQSVELVSKKGKSRMELSKIRDYDEDFHPGDFAQAAQDIYINAHKALAEKDKELLRANVTEKAYPDMWDSSLLVTIRWNFVKSLEPPRVAHIRTTTMVSKDNLYAQITVRFHTQQILAIYDRFGRLIHGSEVIAKDVLEYIVFEKHLSDMYGAWRLHDKIIPTWMPPREPIKRTFTKPPVEEMQAPVAQANK